MRWSFHRSILALGASSWLLLGLDGCSSVLTEGSSAAAGVGGAAVAHAIHANGAVTAGVGFGAQAVALAGVQYLEKRVHTTEQDAIANAAGPLPVGAMGRWRVVHNIPIESDEQGEVAVARALVTPSRTASAVADGMDCKEIVFSIDTVEDNVPRRAFYTAAVCRDGPVWRWASAEPATERWGALQ